jgi:uncharacterized membrane protein
MRPQRAPDAAYRVALTASIGALVLFAATAAAGASEEGRAKAERPERGIFVFTEYSRLLIPVGEGIRMELTVDNKGRRDENVLLALTSVPKGWRAAIKGGQFAVSGVPVASEKSRTLTFTAEPEKGLPPGTYRFELEGASEDRALRVAQTLVVTTEERPGTTRGDLQISTSYPVLRGPTDSSFEFSLEVNNKSDAERLVNLAAEVPKGWDLNIKPSYESKQISSLRIRAGASQTVAVEVKPPRDAEAGEYPVLFRAATDKSQAEARLRVVLTGTYRLDAATPTGRLSLDAVVGKPATLALLVKNTGTAVNRNVKLSSFAPESWKVEFKPETIEAIEPGGVQQVEAKITPAAQALVGDYSVAVTADGEKASKTLELRVTAHAPSTWGWIGVGIIAAVIGGLGGLFAWLGRR